MQSGAQAQSSQISSANSLGWRAAGEPQFDLDTFALSQPGENGRNGQLVAGTIAEQVTNGLVGYWRVGQNMDGVTRDSSAELEQVERLSPLSGTASKKPPTQVYLPGQGGDVSVERAGDAKLVGAGGTINVSANSEQFLRQSQSVAGASIGLPLTQTLPTADLDLYKATNHRANIGIVASKTTSFTNFAGAPVLADTPLVGNLFTGRTEATPTAEAAKTRGPVAAGQGYARRAPAEQPKAAPVTATFTNNGVIVSGAPTARGANIQYDNAAPRKPAVPPPTPQPEIQTRDNAFSTFSLNVSDVSFKLAAASLQNGAMPDAATVRSEEFINAFDYRDPQAAPSAALSFAAERAGYPLAPNRDLLRFSVKTAAQGRQAGRALNLVLLLDKSGSMERADRVAIIREALRVLAAQLQPQDRVSVVVFSRTARLWADGVPGSQLAALVDALEASSSLPICCCLSNLWVSTSSFRPARARWCIVPCERLRTCMLCARIARAIWATWRGPSKKSRRTFAIAWA